MTAKFEAASLIELTGVDCASCGNELTLAYALIWSGAERAYDALCRPCTWLLFDNARQGAAARIDGEAPETHEK